MYICGTVSAYFKHHIITKELTFHTRNPKDKRLYYEISIAPTVTRGHSKRLQAFPCYRVDSTTCTFCLNLGFFSFHPQRKLRTTSQTTSEPIVCVGSITLAVLWYGGLYSPDGLFHKLEHYIFLPDFLFQKDLKWARTLRAFGSELSKLLQT